MKKFQLELLELAKKQAEERKAMPIIFTETKEKEDPKWRDVLGYFSSNNSTTGNKDGHIKTTTFKVYENGMIKVITGDHYIHTYVELKLWAVPKK